jgi:hypothetical protein
MATSHIHLLLLYRFNKLTGQYSDIYDHGTVPHSFPDASSMQDQTHHKFRTGLLKNNPNPTKLFK